jgi:hypothetical protein
VRDGEEHFPQNLIQIEGHLLPREKVIFTLSETVDSATLGKPYVQNDRRVI